MPIREGPPQPAPPPHETAPQPYRAENARGGEIILRTPARRLIFIGGLVGLVVLVLLLRLLA